MYHVGTLKKVKWTFVLEVAFSHVSFRATYFKHYQHNGNTMNAMVTKIAMVTKKIAKRKMVSLPMQW